MHLPVSTPKACLLASTSRMKMKWRVWEQKLLLILAIRQQGDDVLAKQVIEEQAELRLPGLGQEMTNICFKIGLMDICRGRPDRVSKEKIKEQIFDHHLKHMKEELGILKEKGKELVTPLPRRTWFSHSWIKRNLKWPFFICYQGRLIGLFHL